ncbi:MAG: SAM-dependent DNA methyltransferase [Lentisphaeria bacterium]|nr:SAM-dependent DNA methyltransferase [Lentisphaeria bacterium]
MKKDTETKENPLTSTGLFNHLFGACNILRGPIGQDSFKDYITPLLYFKRISDVWDEEYERALAESNGDEEYASFPEQHSFVIPDGCHWRDLRERTENIGSAIMESMREIERQNPDTLYGVFETFSKAQWSNKNVLDDARLKNLVEHFSRQKLGNRDYSADLMGDAYEILLKKFADLTKAKAGEFYTPRAVIKLLVRILNPQPGESVYDPACGSGGMLIEAIRQMKNSELTCGRIFGQEKNLSNAAIAKMNLFLHGASDFHIRQGDTLRDPRIIQNGALARFDCVIANPPFSLEKWGADMWESDRWGRRIWGTPSDSNGDFAWIQHMFCSMKPETGRVGVVMPQGVLFRGNKDGDFRRQMIQTDKLECVITLVNNLFYGAGVSACLLIFRDRKLADHVGKVLLIDGARIYTAKRAQNELSPEDVDRLYQLYADYRDVEEYAKVVSMREIEEHGWSLAPNSYIERKQVAMRPYAEVKQEFIDAFEAVKAAEEKFTRLLKEGGYIQ